MRTQASLTLTHPTARITLPKLQSSAPPPAEVFHDADVVRDEQVRDAEFALQGDCAFAG
jgi:hypothetical protein